MRRQNDLEKERKDFINYIKNIDKSEIKNTTIEQNFTIWQRIKKVMGF
jgi:hypothetical protein